MNQNIRKRRSLFTKYRYTNPDLSKYKRTMFFGFDLENFTELHNYPLESNFAIYLLKNNIIVINREVKIIK